MGHTYFTDVNIFMFRVVFPNLTKKCIYTAYSTL